MQVYLVDVTCKLFSSFIVNQCSNSVERRYADVTEMKSNTERRHLQTGPNAGHCPVEIPRHVGRCRQIERVELGVQPVKIEKRDAIFVE